jgi:shikimate dehydrogenase
MIRLGLIGYPLDHSLSPELHNAALRSCNLQGEYSLYPVGPDDLQSLGALLEQVRSGALTGLNVTIPHKQNVLPFLDGLSPGALAIGAVNTIYLKDGKLMGENTDAPGFLTDLKGFLQEDIVRIGKTGEACQKSALILGAGGSARAVTYALAEAGWKITVAARRMEQAQGLANPRVRVTHYDSSHIAGLLSSFHLIVNTTPVGMFPKTGVSPWIDGLPFPKGAVVYDLIYNPRETLLVKQAHAAGLRTRTGMGMLVEQAALAFQFWTGNDVPRRVLFDAIHEAGN